VTRFNALWLELSRRNQLVNGRTARGEIGKETVAARVFQVRARILRQSP
jgi:hypothetical protein